MTIDSRILGAIAGIMILLKMLVPNFGLAWVWVLSPLWGAAALICAIGLIGTLFK